MIKVETNVKLLEDAIDKLPIRQRAQLAQKLLRETKKYRFKELRNSIRAKVRKHPISQKELDAIVEEAREEFHVKNRG